MNYAICYVSQVSPNLSEHKVLELIENSETSNNQNDITGVLLYSDGNFFQVIEGKKELIQNLFDKIKADERHENIIIIFERPIIRAAYDGFISDFLTVQKKFNPETISHYLQHTQTLDPKSQAVVKTMIKTFLN